LIIPPEDGMLSVRKYFFIAVLFFFIAVSSLRSSALPVKLHFLNEPYPAIQGEPYSLKIEIIAAVEADITDFQIGKDGWTLNSIDFPGKVHLKEYESTVVNLLATPSDTSKPFVLSFRINGLLFQKEYVFSQERYEKLKKITGSDKPFPRDPSSVTDPGTPPDDAKITRQMVQQIAQEIKGMRREIDDMKKEIENLKSANNNKSSADASGSVQMFVKVSIDDDPILGDKNAPVTIIEFSDYECSFCQKFFTETMPELKKKYIDTGKVRFVFRDFTLLSHRNSAAAIAASCAGQQGKYWEMHNMIFSAQHGLKDEPWKSGAEGIGLNKEQFNKCLGSPEIKSEIEKDKADGEKAGVTVTPTYFIGKTREDNIIEGELIKGFQPFEFFNNRIKSLL
jgi:protein-disulfide isomerase